jgi:hypothetical protein
MKRILLFSIKRFLILLSGWGTIWAQSSIEVKFQPAEYIYVYETKGTGTPEDLYTAVIQNMAIVNHTQDSITLQEVEIIATKEGSEIQRIYVPENILVQSAQKFSAYQEQGILQYYDFQFQTSRYLKGINFSQSKNLAPKEALVIKHRKMLFQVLPDLLVVRVKANDNNGEEMLAENTLKVINHRSKNQYYFPLKGTWAAYGAPSLISHHRWGSIQEFAFDLVKIGGNGTTHM